MSSKNISQTRTHHMDGPNNAAHVGIKGATLDPALVRIGHFTQNYRFAGPAEHFQIKWGQVSAI